jgi:hypothetical protein
MVGQDGAFVIAAQSGPSARTCPGCDMRTECLEYALAHDARFGIWGSGSHAARKIG